MSLISTFLAMGVVGGLTMAAWGFLTVVSGQTISCFVSIENNTHATLLAQQAVLKALGGAGAGQDAAPAASVASPASAADPTEIGQHLVFFNGLRWECRRCKELRARMSDFHGLGCGGSA